MDMECNTSVKNMYSGDKVYKRSVWGFRWDGENNKNVYENFVMTATGKGTNCKVVVEWVKHGTYK